MSYSHIFQQKQSISIYLKTKILINNIFFYFDSCLIPSSITTPFFCFFSFYFYWNFIYITKKSYSKNFYFIVYLFYHSYKDPKYLFNLSYIVLFWLKD